jgi:hypothetical protein
MHVVTMMLLFVLVGGGLLAVGFREVSVGVLSAFEFAGSGWLGVYCRCGLDEGGATSVRDRLQVGSLGHGSGVGDQVKRFSGDRVFQASQDVLVRFPGEA